MIKRETIMAHRRVVNKMDYTPTAETVRMLCDGALELLDAVEGGPDTQAQRAALKERERQVKLALADLRTQVAERNLAKVTYTLDLIDAMLRAKGPQWKNEWSWWKPQIDEEFDDAAT